MTTALLTDRDPPPNAAQRYSLGAAVSEGELDVDPYPTYLAFQADEPVSWVAELGMWWVVRYCDVTEILNDDATFTTASADSTIFDTFGLQMLSAEGDEHSRYKRAARSAFQPRALRERLEADIAHWADELIDDFAAPEVDLRTHFAARLPIRTMLSLFGLSPAAAPQLRRWYDAFEAALSNFTGDAAVRSAAGKCVAEFHALLQSGIENARRSGSPGLLGMLVNQPSDLRLSDEEIRRNASIIMFGGISTVEALILNSVWALAVHPEIEARVHENLGLLPRVIDEVLRWQAPVQSATRHVKRAVDFHGHRFRAGDTVNCMLGAANRDPAFLSDGDRFNIDRNPPPRHLAFALGRHFCLGLHLARLQGRIALERLYGRLEGLSVAAPDKYGPRGYEFRRPERLPILWDRERAQPASRGA